MDEEDTRRDPPRWTAAQKRELVPLLQALRDCDHGGVVRLSPYHRGGRARHVIEWPPPGAGRAAVEVKLLHRLRVLPEPYRVEYVPLGAQEGKDEWSSWLWPPSDDLFAHAEEVRRAAAEEEDIGDPSGLNIPPGAGDEEGQTVAERQPSGLDESAATATDIIDAEVLETREPDDDGRLRSLGRVVAELRKRMEAEVAAGPEDVGPVADTTTTTPAGRNPFRFSQELTERVVTLLDRAGERVSGTNLLYRLHTAGWRYSESHVRKALARMVEAGTLTGPTTDYYGTGYGLPGWLPIGGDVEAAEEEEGDSTDRRKEGGS